MYVEQAVIFESIYLMTVIDVIIISLTSIAFWNFFSNRQALKHLKVFSGVALVLTGLVVISSLYIADLISMYVLPLFLSGKDVYRVMRTLHLNYSWLLSTAGIAIIVASLLYLNRIIFPRIIRLEEELTKRATTDSLTQAYNRSEYDEIVQREMHRCKRYNTLLSLLVLDIDHFKKINDAHGHLAGDNVLKEVANIIRENIRGSDYLTRWGGEEFIVLLPETGVEKAEALADRIKDSIENHQFNGLGKVTVSLGVTQYREDDSGEELMKRADEAMYRAKAGGRNRVEVGI